MSPICTKVIDIFKHNLNYFITVVNLVDEVIMSFNDEEQLEKIAEKVNNLMEGRPLFNK